MEKNMDKILVISLIILIGGVFLLKEVRQPQVMPPETVKGRIILYENIIDGEDADPWGCRYGRTKEETIRLINELNPDFVFRGLYNPQRPRMRPNAVEEAGAMIKQINPPVMGAINLKGLHMYGRWPEGRVISQEELLEMVVTDGKGNPVLAYGESVPGQYLADMRSQLYRDFIIAWVRKFRDAGFEYMFFDEPRGSFYRVILDEMGGIGEAVKNWDEFVERMHEMENTYWKDIADRTHALGMKITANQAGAQIAGGMGEKHGYNLSGFGSLPYLDIVTFNLQVDENMRINNDLEAIKKQVDKQYGRDTRVIAFLDWGFSTDTALGRFSALTPEEQRNLLRYYVEETGKYGIDFVLPVHGGWPGQGAGRPTYDFEACCKPYWCYDTKDAIVNLLR